MGRMITGRVAETIHRDLRVQRSILDSDRTYSDLDGDGLGGRIASLPEQLDAAWRTAMAVPLPERFASPERIIVLGMGGSGIGGSLIQSLALDLGAAVPFFVVRGYALPAFVNARTLVLACSNSGNTEETLSSLKQAIDAEALCAVITTGGSMIQIAREHGLPAFTYDWAGEPRAALGWSFATLLAICARCGVFAGLEHDLRLALEQMCELREQVATEVAEARNPAKSLARRLVGKLPVIVGAEALAPVAYRWRTQINENAKSWAIAEELPEMNHNAYAGFTLPTTALPMLHAVFLRHASMHQRIQLRVDATAQEMRRRGIGAEVLAVPGSNILAQVLWAIYFGDFVSYYLGLLNGVRPSPVEAIERLKTRLARA